MTSKRTKKAADDEAAVLEKMAGWRAPYREIGERVHAVIMEAVPELRPKLWYGMPGYAKGGPVLVFFRVDEYMSVGLTEKANIVLDEGAADQLMASAWYLTALDEPTERRIATIARRAAG